MSAPILTRPSARDSVGSMAAPVLSADLRVISAEGHAQAATVERQ